MHVLVLHPHSAHEHNRVEENKINNWRLILTLRVVVSAQKYGVETSCSPCGNSMLHVHHRKLDDFWAAPFSSTLSNHKATQNKWFFLSETTKEKHEQRHKRTHIYSMTINSYNPSKQYTSSNLLYLFCV